MKRLEAEPIVKDVFKSTDAIRIKELEKALGMLGNLDDSQKKIIEELTKSVVENIMATAMNNLRKETEHGNSELIDAASKLFNFKKEDN